MVVFFMCLLCVLCTILLANVVVILCLLFSYSLVYLFNQTQHMEDKLGSSDEEGDHKPEVYTRACMLACFMRA